MHVHWFYFISPGSLSLRCRLLHLSYFPPRRTSSYFSGCVCICARAISKADPCQVPGRLISFVFRTVSSIYPLPVERKGGKSRRYCDSGEPNLTRKAQFPPKLLLLLGSTHSIVQVITFSVAPSSSEETGSPRRASGQRMQFGLAQTDQNSYEIFALVTVGNNNFSKK